MFFFEYFKSLGEKKFFTINSSPYLNYISLELSKNEKVKVIKNRYFIIYISCLIIVSSLLGPVEIIITGTPDISSIFSTKALAFSFKSS